MNTLCAYYRDSQKMGFPKVVTVIVLWFVGLNIVSDFYATLPNFLAQSLPKGVSPTLAKEAMHLASSIILTGVGYVVLKASGYYKVQRKYPRYYVYCHADPVGGNGSLIYGHFMVVCSSDLKFAAEGVAYGHDGNRRHLVREGVWKSISLSPTADRDSGEVFMIYNIHSTQAGPAKTWIAAFRTTDYNGAISLGDRLYELIVQEFSWEKNTQYKGFAELIFEPKWWHFGMADTHSSDALQKLIESNLSSITEKFEALYPRPR